MTQANIKKLLTGTVLEAFFFFKAFAKGNNESKHVF